MKVYKSDAPNRGKRIKVLVCKSRKLQIKVAEFVWSASSKVKQSRVKKSKSESPV